MKKTVSLFVSIVLMLCALAGCQQEEQFTNPYDNTNPAEIPGEVVDIPTDPAALKELAVQLYAKANQLDQQCEYRLAHSICNVTTMGVSTPCVVYDVKNGDEYYKLDYQAVGEIAGMFKASDPHGKATYYRLGMEKAYYIKVGNSEVSYEQGTASADFSSPDEVLWVDAPYFHKSQPLLYQKTEVIINLDTIRSASIVHNDAEGYYTMVLEMDVENEETTSIVQANLRASSDKTKKAYYTSITETFEIWDSGYFKSFISIDKWTAPKAIVIADINSVIDYRTYYSYDEKNCKLEDYAYYQEMKEMALKGE